MKAVVLLCVVAVAAASFHDFKTRYGKKYTSVQEERFRLGVYDENQQFIDEHNEKYENGEVTFTLAMNQFGDMTTDEINAVMNGLLMPPSSSAAYIFTGHGREASDTVDWRTKGAVTPVKDQKACGSCWAFSSTGSLEGQHFLKDGQLVSLSEQNLVDCSTSYGNDGCGGGWMDNAFKYIKANGGIDTEKSYPYKAEDDPCSFKEEDVGATCTGFVDITSGDEDALKKAVHDIGPVSVAIDASRPSFHFYSNGVYYDPDCSPTMLDHGVLAVGYGTASGNGGDYWLVKNSWNTTWGNQGYIEMSRNRDNNCGIATKPSYPLV